MTNTYTQVFGGTTIYPSDVSYLALSLTSDAVLQWPLESSTSERPAARIIDITPTGDFSLFMPPADQTGVGQTILFNNLGPNTVTVKDNGNTTLLSIAQGEQWQIYLVDNTTPAGVWRVFRYGAATAQAQASALAGYGLTATGSTLSQSTPVTLFNTDYTAGGPDRAKAFIWEGGLGAFTLPTAASVGNNWFVSLRNNGAGNCVVTPQGLETINDAPFLTLAPGDSITVITDGTNWFTLGLGQSAVFAFDYTSINLTGDSGDYTLTGSELNRIAYQFTGALAGNVDIVVPKTTQQYWVYNNTTGGSYTLRVKTNTQTPGVLVARGSRAILYCDGSVVVLAETGGIAVPVAVSDGGTGATTAGGALINLGGTSIGTAVFTSVDTPAALTALGGTVVGQSLFTTASAGAARTTLGGTAVGQSVFTAASTSAAQTAIGATAVGQAVFTAASTSAAQVAIGGTVIGQALFTAATTGSALTTLGGTAVGQAIFTTASAADARTTLGGTTVGQAVFTAVDQAAAQAAIGVSGGGSEDAAITFSVALG